MEEPLFEIAGEFFDRIQIFTKSLVLIKGSSHAELTWRDLDLPDYKLCPYEDCRNYVTFPEFRNCALNADRECTLEEVGDAVGLTRERIRQILDGTKPPVGNAPGLLKTLRRKLKRKMRITHSSDLLPGIEIPIHHPKPHGAEAEK